MNFLICLLCQSITFFVILPIFQPCQDIEPTISRIEPADIKPTDSEEVIQLKYKIRRLEIIAENRKKRLNLMWQGKRRLRKKLERMKCMIKHLIKNKQDNGTGRSNNVSPVRLFGPM